MKTELQFWTEERDHLAASGQDSHALEVANARLRTLGALTKPPAAEPDSLDARSMAAVRRFMARHAPARKAEATADKAGEPDYTVAGDAAEVRLYGECIPHVLAGWYYPGEAYSDVGVARVMEKLKGKRVTLRINSVGGDVFGGVAIANMVREAKASALVEGVAASIASVIVSACSKVTMANGSTLMVHAPWSVAVGNAEAHRAEAGTLDKIREAMLDIYVAKTGKKYSRAQWKAALAGPEGADGTWWTAAEAVTVGIADTRDTPAEELPEAKRAALADQRRKVATLYCSKLPAHLSQPAKAASVSYLHGGRNA